MADLHDALRALHDADDARRNAQAYGGAIEGNYPLTPQDSDKLAQHGKQTHSPEGWPLTREGWLEAGKNPADPFDEFDRVPKRSIEDGGTPDVSLAVLLAAEAVCAELRALTVTADYLAHKAAR